METVDRQGKGERERERCREKQTEIETNSDRDRNTERWKGREPQVQAEASRRTGQKRPRLPREEGGEGQCAAGTGTDSACVSLKPSGSLILTLPVPLPPIHLCSSVAGSREAKAAISQFGTCWSCLAIVTQQGDKQHFVPSI